MRYLKNLESGQIAVVVHEANHVVNGHALVLASDAASAPAAGWEESTKAEYDAAVAAVDSIIAEKFQVNMAAVMSASAKLAELGLNPAERNALGLP
jgi:hypothetical protein